jgi:hypothetical protein
MFMKGSIMSIPIKVIALVVTTALLSACSKGPNEKAGEMSDKTVESSTGKSYLGDGPKEEQGEKLDELQKDATEEKADAKALESNQVRTKGELKADTMENEAAAARRKAENKADTLEKTADSVRNNADKNADIMEEKTKKARP